MSQNSCSTTTAPVAPQEGLLDDLRLRIDAVDRTLLSAIAQRMCVAKEIGQRKASRGLGVHALDREKLLLERLTKDLSAEDGAVIWAAYEVLIAGSRRRQLTLTAPSVTLTLPEGKLLAHLPLPEEMSAADALELKLLSALSAGGVVPLSLHRTNSTLIVEFQPRDMTPERLQLLYRDLTGIGATVSATPQDTSAAPDLPGRGMLCGLLGRKLPHTLSPEIHAALAAYTYKCFEVEPADLASFFDRVPFDGSNVTIPYKEAVIPYCTRLTPRAQGVGAVNTLIREADGTLTGDNTDYVGFRETLNRLGLLPAGVEKPLEGTKALVLGSGGASKCCQAVLADLGSDVIVVSRQGAVTYADLPLHADARILVNATPVGMFPKAGISPVPDLSVLPNLIAVVDLIYNPTRTQLLIDAEERGIQTANGLWMLVVQAVEAARRFMHGTEPAGNGDAIYERLANEGRSIVLTGMPGSGKSTIAALVAQKLGRECVDLDDEIEREAGKTIPEIFAESGEQAFRDLETAVTQRVSARRGIVIATGGGTLLRKVNRDALKSNGTLVLIKRPLECLPIDGRPVSQAKSLARIWAERHEIYEHTAEYVIENTTAPVAAAQAILQAMHLC